MTLCVGGLGSTHAVVERTQTTDLQAAKLASRDEMPKRHSKVWAAEAVPSLQADEADEQGRAAEATLEGVGGRGSTHAAVEDERRKQHSKVGERPKRHSKIWAAEAAPNLQANEADKQGRAAEATL
ncbi:hypothetical protein G3M48_010259 [Beauveria asiatica]|uniref:Uncharacterized protein n=1 Tax=Beauveria asiatica TaxID=1069075 RepID=A0AAW0RHF1_9HYPO